MPAIPTMNSTATRIQLASASLPASLKAMSREPMDTASGSTPSQSIFGVSSAVDSFTPKGSATTATAQNTAMTQKMERKPKCSASQPPAIASTPPIPPLTEVTIPSSRAYCFSLGTCWRRMIRHSGTVGPAAPWIRRPRNRTATFGASAATTQPIPVTTIIPISTLRRPIRSPQRGRNRENRAAAVKNAVWVMPIWAGVASSSTSIVARAGASMEALSWKAKTATSRAIINGTIVVAEALLGSTVVDMVPLNSVDGFSR